MKQKRITAAQKQQFEEETKACYWYLLSYIAHRVRTPNDVDGRMDDTLMAAYESYPNFRGDSSFKTWLYSIADNQISNYYRQTAVQIEYLAANKDAYYSELASDQPNPAEQHEIDLELKAVIRAISKLSKNQQRAILWHVVDGLDHAEIGQRLGLSKRGARVVLCRARKKLCELREKK